MKQESRLSCFSERSNDDLMCGNFVSRFARLDDKGPRLSSKGLDGFVAGKAEGKEAGGERIGFGGGGENDGGEDGVLDRMASARVDDVAVGFAADAKRFSPDGGN